MKIRAKISVFLIIVIAFFGIISVIIQTQFLLPSYQKIEQEEKIEILDLCKTFIQDEVNNINLFAADWATWDDSYKFVNGIDVNKFIETNVPENILETTKMDFIFFYNKKEEVFWSKISPNTSLKETPVVLLDSIFKDNNLLFSVNDKTETQKSGILATPFGIILFSSCPIIHSNDTGPVTGTLLMGRMFSKKLIDKISDKSNTLFNILSLNKYDILPVTNQDIEKLKKENLKFVITPDKKHMITYSIYKDVNGKKNFLLTIKKPRLIYSKATKTLNYSIIALIVISILLLIVLAWFINKVISDPVSILTNHITMLKNGSSNYNEHIEATGKRKDEIGILTKEFSNLLKQIDTNFEFKNEIIRNKNAELRETKTDLIFRLFLGLGAKKDDSASHILKTKEMMSYYAKLLNYSDNDATMIGLASTLHDIGWIGFPDLKQVKSKSDSIAEAQIMKQHTLIGANLFKDKNSKLSRVAYDLCLYHHENWNGSGYISGLAGKEIPKTARMMSIIDNLNSKLFKTRFANDLSIDELTNYFNLQQGKLFDPDLVLILLDHIKEFTDIHNKYQDTWNLG